MLRDSAMSNALLAEIRTAIEDAARRREPQPERMFHKHDQYLSYGLRAAEFRRIIKAFRQRILALPLEDRLDLAARLLGEHVGELGHAGIRVVALGVEELGPGHFGLLDRLADHFRSWSHVDHFCGDVMQALLGRFKRPVLKLLGEWSRSPNRWKRRASVVIFTRKVGESGEFTDECLRLCDRLIKDPEDIVQKGVGWALKDSLRSSPERILPYIKQLRRAGVASTITLYAIRDLKGAERRSVLAVKKNPRRL